MRRDSVCTTLTTITALIFVNLEGGDKKKAKNRLRATFKQRSHHMSTFRTGLFLGWALAALIAGVYQCACLASDTTVELR